MKNEIRDYGEIFCEAVDKIVNERLSGVHFDQTILCTVVDDKDKAQGIYTVINSEVKFEAYSLNNTYRKDDEVYVQIPSGDWNEQKIIISKKTKNSKMSVIYEYPFDNYMDITGNIIKNTSEVRDRLIANGDVGNIILWSYNVDDNYDTKLVEFGSTFSQYTRLGIQAQFQSWLKMYPAVSGSYGLILRVEAEKEDWSEKTEGSEDTEYIYYEFKLDAKDMLGDPYNFETYTQQEKLFDIADIPSIRKMELSFYQDYDFYDNNKDLIAESEDANLFVKDVYISFGYDTKEFDNDVVKIYTLESPKYSATVFPPENNHRKIDLRWIHNLNNKLISVDKERYLDYTITWYRHQLGAYSHTAQSGADWVPLSKQSVINGYLNTDIIDADWFLYNETAEDGLYREPGFNYTWLLPDITLAEEKIKAILSYEGESGTVYLQSNILTFSNREEVQSTPTVDAVSALSITCEDKTNGNYYMYGQSAGLLDGSQSGMERIFKVYLKGAELESAESVSWTIPTTHTMISLEDSYYGAERDFTTKPGHVIITRYGNKQDENIPYNVKDNGANMQRYKITGYYSPSNDNNTIQCQVIKNGITYTATKQLSFGVAGTNGSEYTLFLELDDNINAIPCVNKGQKFDTDIVKQDGYRVTAHLYDYSNKEIETNALSNYTVKWEWLINGTHLILDSTRETDLFNNKLKYLQPPIQPNDRGEYSEEDEEKVNNYLTMNELYILKATLNWRGYISEETEEDSNVVIERQTKIQKLEAYLPIPIYQYQNEASYGSGDNATFVNEQPSHIAGATQVLYSSDGYPEYYKDPYQLFFTKYQQQGEAKIKEGTILQKDITWEIYPKADNNNKKYQATLTDDNRLQPLNIYIKNADIYGVQAYKNKKLIWTQPVLVLQNRYPNSAVNAWDGKTLTIDNETGTILSTAITAGVKENDGSFTGVMIGAWGENGNESEKSISSTTGIYGFNQGAMSYAFRDDGTAFLGKSGHGRILFDGNKGEIKSALWDEDKKGGLYMDLDDGVIKLQSQGKYTKVEVTSSNFDSKKSNLYTYGPTYDSVSKADRNNYTFYYELKKIKIDVTEEQFDSLKNKLYVSYDNYKKASSFNTEIKYYTLQYQDVDELCLDTNESNGEKLSIAQFKFNANKTKYFIKTFNNSGKEVYTRVTDTKTFEKGTVYCIQIGIENLTVTEDNFQSLKANLYTKETIYKKTEAYGYYSGETYFIQDYELYTGADPEESEITLYKKTVDYYCVENEEYDNKKTYYQLIGDTSAKYITLSAAESEIPLSIGTDSNASERNFQVNWDGDLYAYNGTFNNGNVEASSINASTISGSTILTSILKSNSRDGEIDLHGAIEVHDSDGNVGGILGFITSNFGDEKDQIEGNDGNTNAQDVSAGIGLSYKTKSYIKATNRNAGLSHGNYYLSLQGDNENTVHRAVLRGTTARLVLQDIDDNRDTSNKKARAALGYDKNYISIYAGEIVIDAPKITFNTPKPEDQEGIYARFA